METDPMFNAPVIQGDGIVTTRQRGIDPKNLPPPPADVMANMPIIQGDPDVTAYRNPGNGVGYTDGAGILHADRAAPGTTLYVDGGAIGEHSPALAPAVFQADRAIDRYTDTGSGMPGVVAGVGMPSAAGAPPVVPPVVGAKQADQPGDDDGDQRDAGNVIASDKPAPGQKLEGAPQVFSKEQIDAAKAKKRA